MDVILYLQFIHPRQEVSTRALSLYVTNSGTMWGQLNADVLSSTTNVSAQYGEFRPIMSSSRMSIISCMSLEIHDVQTQDQCMQMWRETVMQKIPGCVISDVVDVTDACGFAEICEHTHRTHEQQQAECLRTTLTTHVTAPASVAPSKKL